jgi:hypothetical protein
MAADTLVDFVNGFGLAESRARVVSGRPEDAPLISEEATPVLTRVLGASGARRGIDERFAAGLDVIIDGALARNLAGPPATSRRDGRGPKKRSQK